MYIILNIIFTLLIVGGLLWAYVLYIEQKAKELKDIQKGVCPKCKKPTIELKNIKSGGCSGTNEQEYICSSCGYKGSFNVSGGGCSL